MALVTPAEVDAELAATCDYDIAIDVSKAQRRAAALRRKLDFASSSSGQGTELEIDQLRVERQLDRVLAWLSDNASVTEAQRLANPSVIHADFSTFRRYGSSGCDGGCYP